MTQLIDEAALSVAEGVLYEIVGIDVTGRDCRKNARRIIEAYLTAASKPKPEKPPKPLPADVLADYHSRWR